MQLRDLHPRRFFIEAWAALDAEAEQSTSERNPMLVLYIFSVVTISLVLQESLGEEDTFLSILTFLSTPEFPYNHPYLQAAISWAFGSFIPEDETVRSAIVLGGYYRLFLLCYWAFWRVLGFFILPALAVAVHPTLRKRPMGLSVKGMSGHLWVYMVLFIPVLISVFVVSFFEAFQTYYPFYENANRSLSELIIWESFYIAQFFSLEYFFRGFMIQPLRREMGSSVIFAMMIPYVMIHIGKPMIECFAAIIAGVVLGTLALRTRSIWSGILIHVSVALSMDLLSIWQKSRLGG